MCSYYLCTICQQSYLFLVGGYIFMPMKIMNQFIFMPKKMTWNVNTDIS